jgi:hypothetical protein
VNELKELKVTTTNPPKHIDGLIRFLSHPNEKSNEDLAIGYFRNLFPTFTRQSDASRSDGYVPGHFVLELKGKANDWFSGLIQGLAYKKTLDFAVVVVAAEGFLAIWRVEDIPDEIHEEILNKKSAPNKIGKELAVSFKNLKQKILKNALWHDEQLYGFFLNDKTLVREKINSFEKTLKACKKVREKITTKNFTKILKQMVPFFDQKTPIKTASGFYAMIYSWDENSILQLSNRDPKSATLNGEQVKNLIPDKRIKFKNFVENYYVSLDKNENMDDFFAQYDKALDAVDKNFRIQNGMFFTDLDLSKFTMWIVKQTIPDLGKNYIVIDPACGSGNLVTNWKSPLELRHKIVSEIEPELLFAVEKRMKGDSWHNGKFTVVPKVEEGKGLNFLDKSANEYIEIINTALKEKKLKFDKPIAFLCNPPYRGDDDKAADSVNYKIHQSIIDLIGGEGKAERYSCFLAQMKLICDHAAESGLPGDSRLLLFTKSAWLTNRSSFDSLRNAMFSSFDFIDGILVDGQEFFDLKGKFPIAFTLWRYKENKKEIATIKKILLKDLTWIKKDNLSSFPWDNEKELDNRCSSVINDNRSIIVPFGIDRSLLKNWLGIKRQDFIRSRKKSEVDNPLCSGLPKNDRRTTNKSAYGQCNGERIGFMDDLTPCRIDKSQSDDNFPAFRLNSQFMDCKRNRCFSSLPDNRGYRATDYNSAIKTFLWFSLARTFYQIGYPLWADALELWVPEIPKNLKTEVIKYSFAIGFAENECVETLFPANNPIKGNPEIYCTNPMSPTNPSSFWSTVMSSHFSKSNNSLPDRLVQAVNSLYIEWKKRFKINPEIQVSYEQPYFIERGILKPTSGLIQIRDYARHTNDQPLLNLLSNIQKLLKETKQSFYNMLMNSNAIDYFGNPKETAIPDQQIKTHSSKIDAIEKRVILASMIVKSLSKSKNFGRTKFAKVFYLADMLCGHDLKTKYYREAAGPVDYDVLYSEKNKIELLAKNRNYFTTKQTGDFIKFIPGDNINDINNHVDVIFGKQTNQIEKVISLFKNLDTEQSEIVATLFACWNDLLIEREENITEQLIIKEVRNHWNTSKQRFSEARLKKALVWMRKNKIIPLGIKGHTHTKSSKL